MNEINDSNTPDTSVVDSSPVSDVLQHKLDSLARRDWENDLKDTLGFWGDAKNGAVLMQSYVAGMQADYDIRRVESRIAENVEFPSFGFDYGKRGTRVNREKNRITISVDQLSKDSKHNPDDSVRSVRPNGEVVFVGTLRDSYILDGVEETDHIFDEQIHPEGSSGVQIEYRENDRQLTLADYDSSDKEYHGLEAKIKTAEAKNMPGKTQDVLKQRYANATKRRQGILGS